MSGLRANFVTAESSMYAGLPGELIFGMPGMTGGYYTIAVTQPNNTTMRLTFTPSQNTMVSIPTADIVLPQGPKGDPGQADEAQVQALVMAYLQDNPPEVTETDPTVPAWAKAKNKPTYTAAEVGAVAADELDTAVEEALAQAKESGEFDGTTPEFIIGTVETLAAGSNATASITGTAANPVLNLGIPRGQDGAGSGAVATGSRLRIVRSLTLAENADTVNITTDDDGNPFECHALLAIVEAISYEDTQADLIFIPNGIWATNTFLVGCYKITKSSAGWKSRNMAMSYAVPGEPYNAFSGHVIWNSAAVPTSYGHYLDLNANANRASITSYKFSGKFAAGSKFTLIEVG